MGQHSVSNKTGVYNTTNETLAQAGFSNWGQRAVANETIVYTTTNETLVEGGFSNWGQHVAVANETRI